MGWKQQTNTTTGKSDGLEALAEEDRGWSTGRERALESQVVELMASLQQGDSLTGDQYDAELKVIREAVGYSSDGIPLNAGRPAQLAAEDKNWSHFNHEQEWEPYTNRQYVCRYLTEKYHQNPVCKNIINAYVHFVMGSGWSVSMDNDAEQDRFNEWADEQQLHRMWKKWVRETFLYGAAPGVLYPLSWGENAKSITANRRKVSKRRGAAAAFRVLPDSKIAKIYTNGGDYMDVAGYQFGDTVVAPQDVILSTLEPVGLGLRGGSILTPVLEDILKLQKLANSRFYLNLIRSRLPAIREVGAARASGSADAVKKLPPSGSVLTEYGGTKWTFPSHNVDAAGAKDDWRLLVLLIAAGVTLPEFMVLQDASNGNYASTLVAEGPSHNMFKGHQMDFKPLFRRHLKAMGWDNFTIQEPSIVARDAEKEARAVEIGTRTGVMSKRTGAKRLGLDYDEEQTNKMVDEDDAGAGDPLFPEEEDPAQPPPPAQEGEEDE